MNSMSLTLETTKGEGIFLLAIKIKQYGKRRFACLLAIPNE